MYGKNTPSTKKSLVVDGLKNGKKFEELAAELGVATATAEVYGIDGLAAGQEIDHEMLSKYLQISVESFQLIKTEILSNEDPKLRTIRDNLEEQFSYNQIRFVLACLIQELDL